MLLVEVVVSILTEIASNRANECAWDNVGPASYRWRFWLVQEERVERQREIGSLVTAPTPAKERPPAIVLA